MVGAFYVRNISCADECFSANSKLPTYFPGFHRLKQFFVVLFFLVFSQFSSCQLQLKTAAHYFGS
jgi:hypothetical protein